MPSIRRYSWEEDGEEADLFEGSSDGEHEDTPQSSSRSPEPSEHLPYSDEEFRPTITRATTDSPRGRNAPELLLPDSTPEVVPGSNPPLLRNSSLYQPMLTSEDGRSSMGGVSEYDAPKEWTADAAAAAMDPAAHDLEDAKAPLLLVSPPERKYFGLTKRRAIVVASTIAAVLVLAIVLGVALGIKLQHKNAM